MMCIQRFCVIQLPTLAHILSFDADNCLYLGIFDLIDEEAVHLPVGLFGML